MIRHEHEKVTAEDQQPNLKGVATAEVVDFYKVLLPQEQGQKPKDQEEQ